MYLAIFRDAEHVQRIDTPGTRKEWRGLFDTQSSPIFEVTDDSQIRLRAEIDQRDFAVVSAGQPAEVSVSESNFACPARVERIASRMGRHRITRDDAPEPKDRDVVEAILVLGKCGVVLPIGNQPKRAVAAPANEPCSTAVTVL